MSLRIKDATPIDELQDHLLFAVGNTEGDTDGCVSLGQVKDFTDADKAQVAFTGSYLNLSDTPNLESYVQMTTLQQNYYTRNQINQIIGGITGPKFEKVKELPEVGENNIIYLLPQEGGGQQNIFEEYVWLSDGLIYEKIGSTQADFDNYYTIDEVDALIPSVSNATITLQQGGVTKGTFTLNQSSNKTINLDESFVQEQADWDVEDPTAVDFIKNKPTIPTVNDPTMTFTQGGVTKGTVTLNQSQAETIEFDSQVQADWEQEDNSEMDYIKNKPDTLRLLVSYEDKTSDFIDFYIKDIEHIYEYFYIKNAYPGENTITLTTTKNGTPDYNGATKVKYSKNRLEWTELDLTPGETNTITMDEGECVWFKNDYNCRFNSAMKGGLPNINNSHNYYTTFTCSQNHKIGGKLNSLVNGMNALDYSHLSGYYRLFYNNTTLTDASNLKFTSGWGNQGYCYQSLFEGCTSLVNPPAVLVAGFYENGNAGAEIGHFMNMFSGCTSLMSAPILPNYNSVDEYKGMFSGCTSLTTAPQLPNTIKYSSSCFRDMFRECTSLVNPPSMPYSEVNAFMCYDMFRGCTSLVNPPEMNNVTNISNYGCYEMFYGCTSLKSTPTFNLTGLPGRYNCQYMFYGCTSLETVNITFSVTTLTESCYNNIFRNCSLVNEITISADDISARDCLKNWLSNVAATGTFHNLGSATYPTGVNGIPSGWTETNS